MLTHALADPRNRVAAGVAAAAAASVLALPTGLIATGHVLALGVLVAALAAAAWFARLCGRAAAAVDRRRLRARTDELTGTLNEAGLTRLGGRPPAGASVVHVHLHDPVALAAGHGPQAADRVLRAVAARLRGATRAGDLVARVGEDAFVVLLAPGSDAAVVAARVLGRVREPVPFAGALLHPDAAVTVAAACGDAALTDLLDAAEPVPASAQAVRAMTD